MRSNVIVYDEAAPLADILNFLTRAPIRSVVITSQGKPCGLASRAAVVRWFVENRWNSQQSDLIAGRFFAGDPAQPKANLPMLAMADQLVAMAEELRRHVQQLPDASDPAPIIGVLCACSRCSKIS